MSELKRWLQEAINNSIAQRGHQDYRKRSSSFVENLSDVLRTAYQDQDDIQVNKYFNYKKEILFDITVYRTYIEKTPNHHCKKMPEHILWQIESEFALRDSHSLLSVELLKDLGKLKMGSAENKLLITSSAFLDHEEQGPWIKNSVGNLANRCQSNFYLGFVPHPYHWDKYVSGRESVSLFQWQHDENCWQEH